MIPNKRNFCGGNFQDWLEVNLTDVCNGNCSWCVEKDGYHPSLHVGWETIVEQALNTNKQNIILLGGEPTLHEDLSKIIHELKKNWRNVYVTTNGSLLTKSYVQNNLKDIKGINISIHDYNLERNKDITGISIKYSDLYEAIKELHSIGVIVRLNCNCIKGYIDSEDTIQKYVEFSKEIGADKIRFAELKFDEENFVDLTKVYNYRYGLNDDPFTLGCNTDAVIDSIPVNFRQMCGLQTSKRAKPTNPVQLSKQVLYYDGKIYKGWQTAVRSINMTDKSLKGILNSVKEGTMTTEEAMKKIQKDHEDNLYTINIQSSSTSGGCIY